MKHFAPFLLVIAVSLGCISDNLEDGAEMLQYGRLFEAGRRAEYDGNIKIAEDTYCWLIGRGSHYGGYGLAMLLFKLYPDRKKEAVKYLLYCAEHSSHTSWRISDSAMGFAFSIAAMNKLYDIAESELDRPDVAESLRCMMSDIATQEVKAWSNTMKANEVSKKIYKDVIAAVELSCKCKGVVKSLGWEEISKIYLNNEQNNAVPKRKEQRRSVSTNIEGKRG